MLFKKKKSSADKAFELCVDIYGLIKSLATEVKELKELLGVYESKREDTVTAAQILDEYLNGAKENRE